LKEPNDQTDQTRHANELGHGKPKDIEGAIHAAMRSPTNTLEYAQALIALGEQISTVDVELAMRIFREVCEISSTLCHAQSFAKALVRLSWQHQVRAEYPEALIRATHAKQVCEQNNLHDELLGAEYVLAHISLHNGDLDAAEQSFLRIHDLAAQRGDDLRRADYLESLAFLYRRRKQFDAAIALVLEAHEIYTAACDKQAIACANNVARTYGEAGNHELSYAWAKRALSACDPDAWSLYANFLHTTGWCLLNLNNPIDAGVYLFQAEELLAGRTDNQNLKVCIDLDLGRLHVVLNQQTAAIAYFEKTLTLATAIKYLEAQQKAHQALDEIYSKRSALKQANTHRTALQSIEQESLRVQLSTSTALLNAKHKLAELDPVWAINALQRNYDI
jgi:tetratricopeptide (TPR) repeat protein